VLAKQSGGASPTPQDSAGWSTLYIVKQACNLAHIHTAGKVNRFADSRKRALMDWARGSLGVFVDLGGGKCKFVDGAGWGLTMGCM